MAGSSCSGRRPPGKPCGVSVLPVLSDRTDIRWEKITRPAGVRCEFGAVSLSVVVTGAVLRFITPIALAGLAVVVVAVALAATAADGPGAPQTRPAPAFAPFG